MKTVLILIALVLMAGCASNGDQANGPLQRFVKGFGQGMVNSTKNQPSAQEQETQRKLDEIQRHQQKEDFRAMQRGEMP